MIELQSKVEEMKKEMDGTDCHNLRTVPVNNKSLSNSGLVKQRTDPSNIIDVSKSVMDNKKTTEILAKLEIPNRQPEVLKL
ncbi:hypothetical protein scyTo_0025089 [Scyliorhinus torazame]|uniref:Uncharacterized protein n=1 Tax=Scyliorhinus torazame TaxID=75743 RepID=A0A401QGX9_SCYTO|nr:hypothetical protein [Scyliorhinus torazame]